MEETVKHFSFYVFKRSEENKCVEAKDFATLKEADEHLEKFNKENEDLDLFAGVAWPGYIPDDYSPNRVCSE